jgi:hypothetical protein
MNDQKAKSISSLLFVIRATINDNLGVNVVDDYNDDESNNVLTCTLKKEREKERGGHFHNHNC